MASKQRQYHGWIVIEDGGKGYKTYIWAEWNEAAGSGGTTRQRYRQDDWRGESGAALAVEWWDRKVGRIVKLEPTLRGCYRVYTEGLL